MRIISIKSKKDSAMTDKNVICKSDIAEMISERTDLNKKQASDAIGAITDIISESIVAGKSVKFVGFGSFSKQDVKARKGRNPKTGEELDIAASARVKFTTGKTLKTALNQK